MGLRTKEIVAYLHLRLDCKAMRWWICKNLFLCKDDGIQAKKTCHK